MEHPPTISFLPDPPPFPPPFPPSSRTVDLSPLEFILALIAIVTIPALIYTFFFSIECPPRPFRRNNRHNPPSSSNVSENLSHDTDQKDLVSDLKYQKETHVKEVGSECPVCLSGFCDGEEVKQLSVCKHSFHATCIDLWLNSHNNCPVCRASVAPVSSVPAKRSNNASSGSRNHHDLHQGLPDASSLV